jgi:hypothetical protein
MLALDRVAAVDDCSCWIAMPILPFSSLAGAQAASTQLLAEFVPVITRSNLVVWSLTDGDDDGFSAALDTGGASARFLTEPPAQLFE